MCKETIKKSGILFVVLLASVLLLAGCGRAAQQDNRVEIPVIEHDLEGTGLILSGVSAAAFNMNDTFFAVGTGEGSLMIWDINRSRMVRAIRAADNAVTAAAFCPDNRFVAAGASSGAITVYDFFPTGTDETNAVLALTILAAGEISQIAFNSTGTEIIAVAGGELQRYSTSTGSRIAAEGVRPASFDLSYSQTEEGLQIENPQGSLPVAEAVTALAVNIAATWALTGSESGTARLWNLTAGTQIVSYFSFGNAENCEWISMLPNGYYNSSPLGDALMKMVIDDEVFSMSQFSNALFRPDILANAVRQGGSQIDEGLAAVLDPSNAPPRVEIIEPRSFSVTEGTAKLKVKITEGAGGVSFMKVTRSPGDVLVGYTELDGLIQRQYTQGGRRVYEVEFDVPLDPGQNRIGVSVFGERRTRESNPAYANIATTWRGPRADLPDLHVLLMSIEEYKYGSSIQDTNRGIQLVDDYQNGIGNLGLTHDDADAIGKLFQYQENGNLYNNVHIYQHKDEEITKENFKRIFAEVAGKVNRNDHFVFFYAGHGLVDESTGNFFFVPWDSIGVRVPGINEDRINPSYLNIEMDDLISCITSVHAKNTLVLLDTCQSGTLLQSGDTAFEKLIRQLNQRAIITATMTNQDAMESTVLGHGIFTASILDSYEANPDNQHKKVSHLISFTEQDVPVKFARIMQEAQGRGLTIVDNVESQMQKPLAKMADTDFDIFDRYTEHAPLEVRAATSGELSVFGLPNATTNITGNRPLTIELPQGTHRISVLYEDNHLETREITLGGPQMIRRHRSITHGEELPAFTSPSQSVTFGYQIAHTPTVAAAPAGFVYIQPGTFMTGSPANEAERRVNELQHRVNITNGFYMSVYPVTQREYESVMRTNPSANRGNNFPVEMVTWFDAIRYCNERSTQEDLLPYYNVRGSRVTINPSANGYRLPTESEWEYAYRAGTTGPYPTGSSITDAQANFMLRPGRTTEVGRYSPNRWGLYDMAGNVWEWCWDWSAPYAAGAKTDPLGPENGERRIVRGGGFNTSFAHNLRSAYRGDDDPNTPQSNLGFRVIRAPVIR